MIQIPIFRFFCCCKYYFGYLTFLYSSPLSSGHHQSFFSISDFLAESFRANKNSENDDSFYNESNLTHFTSLNSLDIENNILPQHNQKSFWPLNFPANVFLLFVRKNNCTALFLDAQELHSWSTLKANVCTFLYIFIRKFLFQRCSKILSGGEWVEGKLNNFLKAARCLVLRKCFTIFVLIAIFGNSSFFQHFDTSNCYIKTLKLSR